MNETSFRRRYVLGREEEEGGGRVSGSFSVMLWCSVIFLSFSIFPFKLGGFYYTFLL